jgi:hypothetical protein
MTGQQIDSTQFPVAAALADLQTALNDANTTEAALRIKINVLREARKKAEENLVKARNMCRAVLTMRQESIMITLGYLD